MRKILAAAALAAAFAAGPAAAQQADAIAVVDAWARATPRVAHMSAAYMTLRNSGAADRLIGVSSPAASAVEMHTVVRDGDVMRMRPVAAIDVAAGGSVELKPGGFHIMLIGLKGPLAAGATVPLTLTFEKAGKRTVEATVRPAGGMDGGHGMAPRH